MPLFFDNIDSTTTNEKPFLPVFITQSRWAMCIIPSNPKDKREIIIKASKISGVENETVTQFLGDMYQNINIYDNFMDIFGKNLWKPHFQYRECCITNITCWIVYT